jgi:hypothetical protein
MAGAAVVNEALARQLGGRALGRRIRTGTPKFLFADAPEEFEIVGVVDNERFRGLEEPAQPAFYLSTRQFPQTAFSILLRSAGDPLSIAREVRSAIRSVHPAITVDRPTSLERILDEQLVARRLTTEIISGFAAAALGLAALGIFGLLAGSVGSRRREIGVRLAIGASPGSIARTVVGDSLRSVAAGIALGCGLALLAGRLIQGLLVGVSPRDPLTLAGVVVLLLATAIVASFVPARRAARVDPVDALRPE